MEDTLTLYTTEIAAGVADWIFLLRRLSYGRDL
jgi:hypothetical protein